MRLATCAWQPVQATAGDKKVQSAPQGIYLRCVGLGFFEFPDLNLAQIAHEGIGCRRVECDLLVPRFSRINCTATSSRSRGRTHRRHAQPGHGSPQSRR